MIARMRWANPFARTACFLAVVLVGVMASPGAWAHGVGHGMLRYDTDLTFDDLFESVTQAGRDHDMVILTRASASRGAAGRGIDIPGNGVIEMFNNIFAVRMLNISVEAGFEAPIRLYLTEDPDGTATLSYYPPSVVFAPYGEPELDTMAEELDEVFASIVNQAIGQ